MANMMLQEIKDTGVVSIEGFGKYKVPSDIISAITKYPKAFRAGAVGPDFFPDMMDAVKDIELAKIIMHHILVES